MHVATTLFTHVYYSTAIATAGRGCYCNICGGWLKWWATLAGWMVDYYSATADYCTMLCCAVCVCFVFMPWHVCRFDVGRDLTFR